MSEPAEACPRIQRRTLHEEVLERLRDMIIEGRLGPGQRIHESALGNQLGVSRTPLREALKSLASEGLVEMQQSKGAVVRRFSVRDLQNILAVTRSLEQLGGRIACAQASDTQIKAIVAMNKSMMEFYARRDRLEYFKLNQAIHSAIVAASGNPVLVEMHGKLQAQIKRLRFIGNEEPMEWAGAVTEHNRMVAALSRRDADALAAEIGRHLDHTLARICEVID